MKFLLCFLLLGCGKETITGPRGDQGIQGLKGDIGTQGPIGPTGVAGSSCSVFDTSDGALLVCDNGTSAHVYDGTQVTPVALCPNINGGLFKEYMIRINGDLFAVYASGSNIGYTKLWPGSWRTTDGRNCYFTINQDLTVSY